MFTIQNILYKNLERSLNSVISWYNLVSNRVSYRLVCEEAQILKYAKYKLALLKFAKLVYSLAEY